jgi:hypothetical protein
VEICLHAVERENSEGGMTACSHAFDLLWPFICMLACVGTTGRKFSLPLFSAAQLLGVCSLSMQTQNISSSTHHIEFLDACMEH